jgi:hypothetical protein
MMGIQELSCDMANGERAHKGFLVGMRLHYLADGNRSFPGLHDGYTGAFLWDIANGGKKVSEGTQGLPCGYALAVPGEWGGEQELSC